MKKITIEEIEKYLQDLPYPHELATKIADYVWKNENYTLAQIAVIIDDFYHHSCGIGIAEDIECLFGR